MGIHSPYMDSVSSIRFVRFALVQKKISPLARFFAYFFIKATLKNSKKILDFHLRLYQRRPAKIQIFWNFFFNAKFFFQKNFHFDHGWKKCAVSKKKGGYSPAHTPPVFLVAHTGGIAILLAYSQKLLRPSGIFTFLCTTKNNQLLTPKMSPKWCQKWYIFCLHFLIIFWLKKLSIFFVSRRKKWNAGTEKSGDTFWLKIFFEISSRKIFSVRRTPGVFYFFEFFVLRPIGPFDVKKPCQIRVFFSVCKFWIAMYAIWYTEKRAFTKIAAQIWKKAFFSKLFFLGIFNSLR